MKAADEPMTWRDRMASIEASRNEWYQPGPSLTEFHHSEHKVKVLVGGRGSGKTTSVACEAVKHCVFIAGAKVLCVRQTQVSNEDTSVATFNDVYSKMGYKVDVDEDTSLFRKWNGGLTVRIPSKDALEAWNVFCSVPRTRLQKKAWLENTGDRLCSYIMFRGLKDENKSEGQLRGFECSMMVFVEADQLQEQDMDLGVACLRWKDAYGDSPVEDYVLILDTNPPSPQHWIAKMEGRIEKEVKAGDYSNANRTKFWHIRTEENRHNLPKGYIENLEAQYAGKPAHRRRYLEGKYANLFEGNPVYHAFSEDTHGREELPWPQGAYLVRGWDFGSTHAVIWSAYFRKEFVVKGQSVFFEYWWDMHEYYAEMSDVERQCEQVEDITRREFPFFNDRNVCSGVLDYCDPAGAQKKDTGSSVAVLRKNGFFPRWQTKIRSLHTTIAIVNRMLKEKDPNKNPMYLIDTKNCPKLAAALAGQYRYPTVGEPGYLAGEPLKGPKVNGADHVADAQRYPKINLLRLVDKVMNEKLNPAVGPIGNSGASLNRKRRHSYQ